jgi:hypothetical protein
LLSKNIKIKIYRTVVLRVVLYGCETWSFILTEEHRLRVFENRVLRRMQERRAVEDHVWRGAVLRNFDKVWVEILNLISGGVHEKHAVECGPS